MLRWKGCKRYKLVLFKCGIEMQSVCKMCVESQLMLPLKYLVKYLMVLYLSCCRDWPEHWREQFSIVASFLLGLE